MTTSVTEKKRFVYDDYLKTPEDKRYELLDGDLIMKPSPVPYHQWISKNLEFELERFVREQQMGIILDAPCDVFLDESNVLQPDILFISSARRDIIGPKNIQGAPDLVIEILSEATAYHDLVKKKKLYARFGVKEYWIVDPAEKNVELYGLKDGLLILLQSFSATEALESPLFPGLAVKLSAVFAF